MAEIDINLEKPQLSHGALCLASSSPVTTVQLFMEAWHSRTSCAAFGQNRWVNPLPCILLSTLGKSFNILPPASKTLAVEAKQSVRATALRCVPSWQSELLSPLFVSLNPKQKSLVSFPG